MVSRKSRDFPVRVFLEHKSKIPPSLCGRNAPINSFSAHLPPDNRGAFANVVNPGGGTFAILSRPRALGISVPQGDPQAFDTSVKATTSREENVRGQINMISVLRRLERVFRCYIVCETKEDYKEGCLMVWTNYMSPCNSIVGLYFEGTYDVISVTMATHKVRKSVL